MTGVSCPAPTDMAARLIVALDVERIERAREVIRALDGLVGFFKIGFWLLLQPGVDRLIDDIVANGGRVFLDVKMYDIGETVRRGVQGAIRRGVSFLTVHGDPEIMRAAVEGRGDAPLHILAVSVLTSLNGPALQAMGYDRPLPDLVRLRVRNAAQAGCDGLIASATDDLPALRREANRPGFLIVTPGIRLAEDRLHDHARPATPAAAIAAGADYLVVGRPILHSADPAAKAAMIVAEMAKGRAAATAGE